MSSRTAGRPVGGARRYAVAAFLPVVVTAAALCLGFATVGVWRLGTLHPLIDLAAIAAVVLTGFAPVSSIDLRSYAVVIYLDSAVLIALALVVPPAEVIAVFTVGQLLSVLALRQGLRYMFVNVGMAVLGSTAAVLLLDALRGAPGTPREVGTVLVMSAAYVAVTLLITSLSFTCERGGSVLGGLRQTCRLSVTVGPLVLDSIGYLAVVVGRSSIWALLLMAGPIALLTVTTRVLDRAQSDRIRLRELVTAADLAHAASDVDDVIEVLVRQAGAMLRRAPVVLRDREPSPGEFGAALTIAGAEKWLVATPRELSKARHEDSQALHALVGMVQSVVANRELLAAASHQSLHDPLTGLANRALFAETLALELQRSSRTGESLAVVFLDLDGFKLVNDQLGHAAGDSLLVETARRLKAGVRTSDLVARIGGDEFCALLTACGSRTDAMRVAASLCLLVAAPYPLDSGVARVAVSAGVAIGCDDDADAGELLRKADQAMYLAKRRGTGEPVAWAESVPDLHSR